jgi:RimJ/RimL family protein N-acetyltransferase
LISGKLTQSLLEAFLPLIRQKRIVRLQCPPKTHNNTLDLAQYGFVPLARREYHYNSKTLLHIPNSSAFELKPIDNALLFDACMWKPLMLDIYQNFNHYLQHAIGFVLWDPLTKRVVSETHGVGADQLMEIATVTHPDYQNKQLASIICNHLINTRMQAGKNTIWSCDEHNIASGKVAEKQGMAEMIPYDFYIYKRI